MLQDKRRAGETVAVLPPPQKDDRVGIRGQVALHDLAGDEILQHNLIARLQDHRRELVLVVGALGDQVLDLHPFASKQVPRDPVVIGAQDLLVDELDELELDGVLDTDARFDAINHDPARAPREAAVEEGGRRLHPTLEPPLPTLPLGGVHVSLGHRTA